MESVSFLAGSELDEMLEAVARRNHNATITRFGPTYATIHRAKLSSHSTSLSAKGLLLLLEQHSTKESCVYSQGDVIGVSLRISHKKCMFSTVVLDVVHDEVCTRLVVDWPTEVELVPRRAFERVMSPADRAVPVRFCPHAASNDARPQRMRFGQLENISVGGMQLTSAENTAPSLSTLCQCIITPDRSVHPLTLMGVTRHRIGQSNNRVTIGFQFVGLEQITQRETLSQLLALVKQWKQKSRHSDTLEGKLT